MIVEPSSERNVQTGQTECTQLARALKGTAACEQIRAKVQLNFISSPNSKCTDSDRTDRYKKKHSLNTNGPAASAQQKEKGDLDNNSEARQSHANT